MCPVLEIVNERDEGEFCFAFVVGLPTPTVANGVQASFCCTQLGGDKRTEHEEPRRDLGTNQTQ